MKSGIFLGIQILKTSTNCKSNFFCILKIAKLSHEAIVDIVTGKFNLFGVCVR
jgi:hypothetical protein